MEASIQLNEGNNKLANSSIGIGGNYNDKTLLDDEPVVHTLSVSKAEKRLKKLERDYQHYYQKYIEAKSNRYRFNIEAKHSRSRGIQAASCIRYYKNLRAQLQDNLGKLNTAEAIQKGIERHDHCKQVSILHSYKSLVEERRMLQQIEERQQYLENNDRQSKEKLGAGATTVLWNTSWEVQFKENQSKIPRSCSSKEVHDLLRRFKDTEKLKKKAIANAELVNNPTSDQDNFKISSIEMEIKLLTKVIKKLEKQRGNEARIGNEYEEKLRHLEQKCEWICGKWDEEKKYIVKLKNACSS